MHDGGAARRRPQTTDEQEGWGQRHQRGTNDGDHRRRMSRKGDLRKNKPQLNECPGIPIAQVLRGAVEEGHNLIPKAIKLVRLVLTCAVDDCSATGPFECEGPIHHPELTASKVPHEHS